MLSSAGLMFASSSAAATNPSIVETLPRPDARSHQRPVVTAEHRSCESSFLYFLGGSPGEALEAPSSKKEFIAASAAFTEENVGATISSVEL